MTQEKIIEAAKKAGILSENGYPILTLDGKFYDEGLTKFLEIIVASQAQPTPSQSDERAEFEQWFDKEYQQGKLLHGDKYIAEYVWQARAQLSKPQPTSQYQSELAAVELTIHTMKTYVALLAKAAESKGIRVTIEGMTALDYLSSITHAMKEGK